MKRGVLFAIVATLALGASVLSAGEKMKALIVDGQNNHKAWPQTTLMMKRYLEETGLFTVEVATTKPKGVDASFAPDFSSFDVVVSNYNGTEWPEATQKSFEKYVDNGGGVVIVHAADNAFPNWEAYNQMIGVGGWGGRTEKDGPRVFFDSNGKMVRDTSPGRGGHHGKRLPYAVIARDQEHPILKGLPGEFLHAEDELYDSLRGPATQMDILATAYSDPSNSGTGNHEPMLMAIRYGKGRVMHTAMGHDELAQSCVGFIVTFQRGAEWAATGKVTQSIPDDFPTASETSLRAQE